MGKDYPFKQLSKEELRAKIGNNANADVDMIQAWKMKIITKKENVIFKLKFISCSFLLLGGRS